ncbi:MAG: hypothetical protein ACO1HP_15005 [Bacteroidota bacterium]
MTKQKQAKRIKINKMSRADILGEFLPRAMKNIPGSKYESHLIHAADRLKAGSRRF